MSPVAEASIDVPAGQAVFREGEAGQSMYIVESGAIEIRRAARGTQPVAVLGPGDFFGEMAMLEDQPRFASALAREPTRLLRIERAEFADLVRQNIEIAVRIMRKLVARQRRTENQLAEALAEVARLRAAPAPAAAAPAARPAPVQVQAPVAAAAAPAASPAPAAAVATGGQACQLRHASGAVFTLDPAIAQFMVGRPDPTAGINPEIDLSGIDTTRSLSRRHAKLVREGRLYFVREEVGTVNGTYVNDVRVRTGVDVPIKPGDRLRFGMVEVDFAVA